MINKEDDTDTNDVLPDEYGNVQIDSHIRIFDPDTNEELLNIRGDD